MLLLGKVVGLVKGQYMADLEYDGPKVGIKAVRTISPRERLLGSRPRLSLAPRNDTLNYRQTSVISTLKRVLSKVIHYDKFMYLP